VFCYLGDLANQFETAEPVYGAVWIVLDCYPLHKISEPDCVRRQVGSFHEFWLQSEYSKVL
jgi:hypothetical protein